MLNHKDKRLWTVHEKQDLINRETYKKNWECCGESESEEGCEETDTKELGMLRPFPNSTLLISRYIPANF